MAKKTSSFLVGLFVTLGLVFGTVLVIWVGASRYFEPGNRYATYFDESVQGLQKDSTVKYRGVDVGRVERIRVAPDNHLVEVVMKIDLTEDIRKGMAAELKSAGITGIMFVELARVAPGEKVSTPKITFATEYPVIPSRISTMQRVFAQVEEVMEKMKAVDFEGVSDQFKATGKAAERFFDGPRTRALVDNLERTTRRIDETVARVDNVLSGGRLEKVADAMEADLDAVGRLTAKLSKDIEDARIPDRSAEAKQVLDEAQLSSCGRPPRVEGDAAFGDGAGGGEDFRGAGRGAAGDDPGAAGYRGQPSQDVGGAQGAPGAVAGGAVGGAVRRAAAEAAMNGGGDGMAIRWWIPIAAAILCLAGCFRGAKAPAPEERYVLEYPSPGLPGAAPLSGALRVGRFGADESLKTARMVFRPEPFRKETDFYNLWAVAPDSLVTDFLLRDFRRAGPFRAVFAEGEPQPARFLRPRIPRGVRGDRRPGRARGDAGRHRDPVRPLPEGASGADPVPEGVPVRGAAPGEVGPRPGPGDEPRRGAVLRATGPRRLHGGGPEGGGRRGGPSTFRAKMNKG